MTIRVTTPLNYPQHPNPFGFGHGSDWDQVHDILNTSYTTISGIDPRYFFLGEGPYQAPRASIGNRGNVPENRPYDSLSDVKKFTNPIGFLASGYGMSAPPSWEKQVGHLSLSGDVIDRDVPLYTFDQGLTRRVWGVPLPVPDQSYVYDETLTLFPIYETLWGGTPLNPGHNYSLWTWDQRTCPINIVLDALDNLQEKESPVPYLGFFSDVPVPSIKCYGDISYDGSKFGVFDVEKTSDMSISYKVFLIRGLYARLMVHEIRFEKVFRGITAPGTALGIDIFAYVAHRRVSVTYFLKTPYPVSIYGNWMKISDTEDFDWDDPIASNCFPYTKVAYSRGDTPNLLDEGKSVFVKNTYKLFSDRLGTLRPAIMMSFSDAMVHYRNLTSNYIEVIAEADELLHFAPDLRGLFASFQALRFYKDLRQGGIVDGVLGIADFFSATYLLNKFGWRPAVQNADEITSKLDRIGSAIKSLQAPMTLHGSFKYDLGTFLGIKNCKLVARSKLRFNGISDDFLIASLNLDAQGLLPRSSNLWDLVPWSWFVDYFTGLSGRYDVLDSAFIAMAMDMRYAVHSIAVTAPVPDSVLTYDSLMSSFSEPAKFKVYFRETSVVVPFIMQSEIDFGMNSYGPDKGILLALLWQLARGFFAP
jgi:hypothetical protein